MRERVRVGDSMGMLCRRLMAFSPQSRDEKELAPWQSMIFSQLQPHGTSSNPFLNIHRGGSSDKRVIHFPGIVRHNTKQVSSRVSSMARGNQRDKAREKNLKAQAGMVRHSLNAQQPAPKLAWHNI